ncbi:MAG: hypothetical protein ACKPKO_61030, partial [Candidatus Fonsibacter sp.]
DIYEWIKQNKQHFDLSDSIRTELKDNTNKKVLGKFKDEMNTLIMTEFVALHPKVYSINHQTLNEFNELEIKKKKKLKGVSTVVVKKKIKHDDYIQVKESNKPIMKEVVSIRSFNHHIYTYKQSKIVLTSLYDKLMMVDTN